MSLTFTEEVTLEKIECGSCGGILALTHQFLAAKRREGGWFTCPYCKATRGWGKNDADRLREELESKRKELTAAKCELLNQTARREIAEKILVRHKKRTKNGVCPCCQRSFINLKRHIASKHPTYCKT